MRYTHISSYYDQASVPFAVLPVPRLFSFWIQFTICPVIMVTCFLFRIQPPGASTTPISLALVPSPIQPSGAVLPMYSFSLSVGARHMVAAPKSLGGLAILYCTSGIGVIWAMAVQVLFHTINVQDLVLKITTPSTDEPVPPSWWGEVRLGASEYLYCTSTPYTPRGMSRRSPVPHLSAHCILPLHSRCHAFMQKYATQISRLHASSDSCRK